LWGLTLNAWDALIPLFFAISAIFAILGGSATYVAFKLHKQEALNANEDLKRYELALDAKIDAAKAKGLDANEDLKRYELALDAKIDAAKAKGLDAEQAVKDAILNAAEANRRAAKVASSLEHKPSSTPRQSEEIQTSRALKAFAGQEYLLSVAPDTASTELGSRIDGTLQASGWRREVDISYLNLNSMSHTGKPHTVGLSIIVPGRARYAQMRPALALQQALAGSGLQPNIIRDPALHTDKDIIEISVGPTP
jgi:hypothetical protein